jgi:polysaccharide biosynthesis protein PslG
VTLRATLGVGSPFGLNSHLIQTASLEKLAEIGIRWHRVDFDWPDVQPHEQGSFNWADTDRIVGAASRLNLNLLVILAYTPAWASASRDKGAPPRDPRLFLEYVAAVVHRYRGEVAAWSVWNEPNLKVFWKGSRREFIDDIWVPGLNEIRGVDPDAFLVGPDLSSTKNNAVLKDWLPECLRASRGLLSAVAHHQYDGRDTVQGRVAELARVRDAMDKAGASDLPLWVTEIGWDRVSPNQQAQLLTDVYAEMRPRQDWWEKTFWYDSHGKGWGLLEPDGSPDAGAPRPAFHAYSKVVSEADQPPKEGD